MEIINKYDPSGHFAISVGFLIGSILIGAALGAGIRWIIDKLIPEF